MTNVQNLNLKFKFCSYVIHPTIIIMYVLLIYIKFILKHENVYTVSVYKIYFKNLHNSNLIKAV